MIASKIIKSIVRGGPGIGIMITYFLISIFGYLMGIGDPGKINLSVMLFLAISTLMTLGVTNILDDYFDFRNGIDKEGDANSMTRVHLIVHNIISPRKVLILGLSMLIVPISFMIYIIIYMNRYYSIIFALIALIILIEYAGPPLKYRYKYFGEIGVFVSIILVISGSYYVASGVLNMRSVVISIPLSLMISDLAFIANTRDISTDKMKGIKTLSMVLGERRSAITYLLLFIVSYALTVFMIFIGLLPKISSITLTTIPLIAYNGLKFIRNGVPKDAQKTGGLITMLYMILLDASLL